MIGGAAAVAQLPVPHEVAAPCDPVEGDCGDGGNPRDALHYLDPLGEAVAAMQEDLQDNWFLPGVCRTVEYSQPVVTQTDDVVTAAGWLYVLDPGDEIIPPHNDPATVEITTNLNRPGVDVTIDLDDVSGPDGGVTQQWTLTLRVSAAEGSVYLWGAVERHPSIVDPQGAVFEGGWIYTPGVGPQENPASDPGFHNEVANMMGCDATVAGGLSLGSLLNMLGNGLQLAINYVRDLFKPYRPPTSCLGPKILDGAGQSCENQTIPCAGDLDDVAEYLDDLPGVSTAFKKCLKGRLGCGGSSFPRLRISCSDANSCGPCAVLPDCQQLGCDGCNVAGTSLWYCADSATNRCRCVEIIFHEASHACGALDLLNGAANDSYRIGEWFDSEFKEKENLDNQCRPDVHLQFQDSSVREGIR